MTGELREWPSAHCKANLEGKGKGEGDHFARIAIAKQEATLENDLLMQARG